MISYLLNLDSETSRLEWMATQFSQHDIHWERISGIDMRNHGSTPSKGNLSPPEIGCMQSHAKAWQCLIDSGDKYGAIFEDDAILSVRIKSLLASDGWIPDGVELLRLETSLLEVFLSREGHPCPDNTALHRSFNNGGGAGGYILSAQKARKLLRYFDKNRLPIDLYLFPRVFESQQFGDVIIYQIVPGVCLQTIRLPDDDQVPNFDSAIGADGSRFKNPKRSFPRRLRDKIHHIYLQRTLAADRQVVNFVP